MGLPLPLATCLSWVGPPSNLGGGAVYKICGLAPVPGVRRVEGGNKKGGGNELRQ